MSSLGQVSVGKKPLLTFYVKCQLVPAQLPLRLGRGETGEGCLIEAYILATLAQR